MAESISTGKLNALKGMSPSEAIVELYKDLAEAGKLRVSDESMAALAAEPDTLVKPFCHSYEYAGTWEGFNPCIWLKNLSLTTDRLLAFVFGTAFPADGLYLTKDNVPAMGTLYLMLRPFVKVLKLAAAQTGFIIATVSAVKSTGIFTLTGQPSNGQTITIGTGANAKTYTFRTTLTTPAVANEIKIGASAEATIDNAVLAINGGAGAGTNYSTGTTAHALVVGTKSSTDKLVVTAKLYGTIGNASPYTLAETCDNMTVSNALMGAGAGATAGVDQATTINFTAVANTQYFLNMTAKAACKVAITTNSAHVAVVNNAGIGAANGMPAGNHAIWLSADATGGATVITLTGTDPTTAEGNTATGMVAGSFTDTTVSTWVELRAVENMGTGDLLAGYKA